MTKAIARNLAVIENAGPNNLKAFLHDALDEASSADIGRSF